LPVLRKSHSLKASSEWHRSSSSSVGCSASSSEPSQTQSSMAESIKEIKRKDRAKFRERIRSVLESKDKKF
jgi:hypothetical protein